jgi:hypothetical protein
VEMKRERERERERARAKEGRENVCALVCMLVTESEIDKDGV